MSLKNELRQLTREATVNPVLNGLESKLRNAARKGQNSYKIMKMSSSVISNDPVAEEVAQWCHEHGLFCEPVSQEVGDQRDSWKEYYLQVKW